MRCHTTVGMEGSSRPHSTPRHTVSGYTTRLKRGATINRFSAINFIALLYFFQFTYSGQNQVIDYPSVLKWSLRIPAYRNRFLLLYFVFEQCCWPSSQIKISEENIASQIHNHWNHWWSYTRGGNIQIECTHSIHAYSGIHSWYICSTTQCHVWCTWLCLLHSQWMVSWPVCGH